MRRLASAGRSRSGGVGIYCSSESCKSKGTVGGDFTLPGWVTVFFCVPIAVGVSIIVISEPPESVAVPVFTLVFVCESPTIVGVKSSMLPLQAEQRMMIAVKAPARAFVLKSDVILSSNVNVFLELRHHR